MFISTRNAKIPFFISFYVVNLKSKLDQKKLIEEYLENKEIEENRVDKNTKDKRMNVQTWEKKYNARFRKYMDSKTERISKLDQMWNKPNQGIPQINSPTKTKYLHSNKSHATFEHRVNHAIDKKYVCY